MERGGHPLQAGGVGSGGVSAQQQHRGSGEGRDDGDGAVATCAGLLDRCVLIEVVGEWEYVCVSQNSALIGLNVRLMVGGFGCGGLRL